MLLCRKSPMVLVGVHDFGFRSTIDKPLVYQDPRWVDDKEDPVFKLDVTLSNGSCSTDE